MNSLNTKGIRVLALVAMIGTAPAWAGGTPKSDTNANSSCDSSDSRGCGDSGGGSPPMASSAPPSGTPTAVGMPVYSFKSLLASLSITDTPAGYTPPVGPRIDVTLTYNQREANQPAVFDVFNLGPQWSFNWLTWIQDDPAAPGSNVLRYVAGGGGRPYSGYNATTHAFAPETDNGAVLVQTASSPITYELRHADGARDVFAAADGHTAYPRKVLLTQRIDPQGNTVTLSYDAQHRLTAVTDAIGQVTTFAYGNAGNPLLVTGVTDPFGRNATFAYDGSGRLTAITDVAGMTSTFAYDSGTFIQSLTTPYGTTAFAHTEGANGDPQERSIQATDPAGATERTEYLPAAPGIPYSDTQTPGGMAIFNQYLNYRDSYYWDKNAFAQACSVSGGVTTCDYTRARNKHFLHLAPDYSATARVLESIKYPLEGRIWYDYRDQGGFPGGGTGSLDRPTHVGRVLDDGSTQLTTYAYNTLGNVTQKIDPVGRVTLYDYAANQIDRVAVRQQIGAGTYATLASVTYDARHRPLTATDAAGQTTTYTYNAAGQVLTETNALNQVTTWTYDALGYLLRVQNPDNSTRESYTYDAYGRVASRTDSEGHSLTFAYDALDRLTRVGYPDGSAETTAYDRLDVASRTDRLGRTTAYTHDAVRNLTAETDPAGRITRYGYDANGLLKTLTDANGHPTTWERDLQGRVTAKVHADGSRETYAYEARTSRLRQRTDPLGQIASRTYTQDDRPATLTYGNTINATSAVNFVYDEHFPRLTGMTDGNGTTSYQYVPAGVTGALQLASEDGPFTNDGIAYTYDALGRVQTRTLDAVADSFAYDLLGRLVDHATPLAEFAYEYLGATDQRTRRSVVGNAVAACPGSVRNEHAAEQNTCTGIGHAYGIQRRTVATLVSTWQYADNLHDRRLTGITHLDGGAPAGARPRSYTYVTDPENRILNQTESLGETPLRTWTYGYDPADRLTNALVSPGGAYGYDLDPGDNPLGIQTPTSATTTTYDNLNQIALRNAQPFTWDAAGNLADDGQRSYAWDAEQRLIRIRYTGTNKFTEFRYDGLGRRTAVIDSDGTTATETRYLWCGERLCQARDGADTVTRRYYAEGELAVAAAGDVAIFYAEDHLGSIRDLRLGDGQVLASYDYDPYGNPTRATSTNAIRADYRYAGLFQHAPSGLYLTHYRVYDPGTARWISRDPIGETGGINLYAYVAGNPLSFIDLLGLDLTPAEQAAVQAAAQDWSNSNVPYVYGGNTKSGADCSGSVSSIYKQAGIDIGRMSSQGFKSSPLFTPVTGSPQIGDVGVYPGHVDIYGGNTGQGRDAWSASHTGGPPFGPADSAWYGKPTWYRYTPPGTTCGCGR